jgi:hypothetical protein
VNYYTGIGSRQTPEKHCAMFTGIAFVLSQMGYILRSGGADGADTAFENGVSLQGEKEIYLPWKNFNKNPSPLYTPLPEAYEIAKRIHPAWHACTRGAKMLHARNVHQVLGQDLKTPSKFVLCWTLHADSAGGTRTAIEVAKENNIPVHNFGNDDFEWGWVLKDGEVKDREA